MALSEHDIKIVSSEEAFHLQILSSFIGGQFETIKKRFYLGAEAGGRDDDNNGNAQKPIL